MLVEVLVVEVDVEVLVVDVDVDVVDVVPGHAVWLVKIPFVVIVHIPTPLFIVVHPFNSSI